LRRKLLFSNFKRIDYSIFTIFDYSIFTIFEYSIFTIFTIFIIFTIFGRKSNFLVKISIVFDVYRGKDKCKTDGI
jgi:hypothetical protein